MGEKRMTLKRVLPFFVIIFVLTGCFRQASDTFDTVDSTGGEITQIVIPTATATATEESAITIIAPGLETATPLGEVTATEAEAQTASNDEPTDVPVQPTTP